MPESATWTLEEVGAQELTPAQQEQLDEYVESTQWTPEQQAQYEAKFREAMEQAGQTPAPDPPDAP
jgi:hypothetical protein